jgi:hypothetical protein
MYNYQSRKKSLLLAQNKVRAYILALWQFSKRRAPERRLARLGVQPPLCRAFRIFS